MQIILTPKELADLVASLQSRQEKEDVLQYIDGSTQANRIACTGIDASKIATSAIVTKATDTAFRF